MMNRKKYLLLGLLLAAAVFLAGCTTAPATPAPTATPVAQTAEPAATTVGEAIDNAVSEAEQVAEEARQAVEGAVDEAKEAGAEIAEAAGNVVADVGEAAGEAAEAAGQVVEDVQAKAQELVEAVKARLAADEPLLLSAEELAVFDGKDGKPAYVAVDGVLYDMSQSAAWKNGAHNGFEAGRDLTKEIKEISPHGVANLERVTAIGRLKVFLTLAELAQFNGKDGKPAYVAVDGVIYDVTASAAWKNGAHNGFEAGKDLTKEIKEVSPHGVAKLENVVEIGVLVP